MPRAAPASGEIHEAVRPFVLFVRHLDACAICTARLRDSLPLAECGAALKREAQPAEQRRHGATRALLGVAEELRTPEARR